MEVLPVQTRAVLKFFITVCAADEGGGMGETMKARMLRNEAVSEVVEIPKLGKETSTDASMAGKIATFVAGIVSVIALLVLGIALKRRKADN